MPKGAHARGYALQLKIKHCWKLFLFQMLCCVLAWMIDWLIDDHLYSAILRSLEQTHCARLWFYMSDKLFFIACFLNIHRSGVLTALAWLVPHETAAISAQVLCTPYNHAPCHFMRSHIRKVYACLAVTCHLHFLAEWPGSFTCYCGNTGVEQILK